jgi:hypothetical protein
VRETTVEDHLVSGVGARGGACPKWVSPNRVGPPDRIVLLPGSRIIFVETKAPDGVLKSWQARFHKMLRALGFRVEVLWTIEQVDAFLATLSP